MVFATMDMDYEYCDTCLKRLEFKLVPNLCLTAGYCNTCHFFVEKPVSKNQITAMEHLNFAVDVYNKLAAEHYKGAMK